MIHCKFITRLCMVAGGAALVIGLRAADSPPVSKADGANSTPAARFSVQNMDPSIDPGADFYHFAAGNWLKSNPVPADKSRWSGFEELQERNWRLIREILESAATDNSSPAKAPRREVGDFFASA